MRKNSQGMIEREKERGSEGVREREREGAYIRVIAQRYFLLFEERISEEPEEVFDIRCVCCLNLRLFSNICIM